MNRTILFLAWLSVSVLPSCTGSAAFDRQVGDATCLSHMRKVYLEILDASTKGLSVEMAIKEMIQQKGKSVFQCPVCGQIYQISSELNKWKRVQDYPEDVVLYCPSASHSTILAINFAGGRLNLNNNPTWKPLDYP